MVVEAKAICEITAAGRALEDFAEKQPVGALIDYPTWDRVGLIDVRKHRSILAGAFKRLQRRTGAKWVVVKGVGYKRADDVAKLDAAQDAKSRAVRQVRNGMAVLVTVEDVGSLSERDQARYHGLGNRLAVMVAIGASRSKKLDHKAEDFSPRAALSAVVKALK
jgi:hypothetical protein